MWSIVMVYGSNWLAVCLIFVLTVSIAAVLNALCHAQSDWIDVGPQNMVLKLLHTLYF